jgi:hypothetical protein
MRPLLPLPEYPTPSTLVRVVTGKEDRLTLLVPNDKALIESIQYISRHGVTGAAHTDFSSEIRIIARNL